VAGQDMIYWWLADTDNNFNSLHSLQQLPGNSSCLPNNFWHPYSLVKKKIQVAGQANYSWPATH